LETIPCPSGPPIPYSPIEVFIDQFDTAGNGEISLGFSPQELIRAAPGIYTTSLVIETVGGSGGGGSSVVGAQSWYTTLFVTAPDRIEGTQEQSRTFTEPGFPDDCVVTNSFVMNFVE
jgi:hypothetical protein